ncbi:unnamed protein product [Protopolystoma xenopodis]|uniref:Uncharacterized protein n=1 Tax=Protopolystoma xenopodis TaxID=117903 RepID=A0A3S5BCI1_9PLAT|nr:unnamed protein product [Protopolystoma xenopodis]
MRLQPLSISSPSWQRSLNPMHCPSMDSRRKVYLALW